MISISQSPLSQQWRTLEPQLLFAPAVSTERGEGGVRGWGDGDLTAYKCQLFSSCSRMREASTRARCCAQFRSSGLESNTAGGTSYILPSQHVTCDPLPGHSKSWWSSCWRVEDWTLEKDDKCNKIKPNVWSTKWQETEYLKVRRHSMISQIKLACIHL